MASEVKNLASQTSKAKEEISRSAQEAVLGMKNFSTNVSSVKKPAVETGTAADQVLSAAKELSQQSEGMKEKIQLFL